MTHTTDDAYFVVCGYKVTSERLQSRASRVQAIVEVNVGSTFVRRSATGVGPVHALDEALRQCLAGHYWEVADFRLSNYRVEVVNAEDATASQVRVMIEASDGISRWDAGCVSHNIVDASFEALCATTVMGLLRLHARINTLA